MFNTISWQQYFAAVFVLSAPWYAYVGLRYYQSTLHRWLKIKPQAQSILPPVASQFDHIMGVAEPEVDCESFAAEELVFTAAEPDDISDQTLPAGPADELLAEAKILINTYGDHADKGGFLSLFRLLLNKYEVFADEISLPAVISALREFATGRLAFSLDETEWPLTFNPAVS